MRKPRAEARCGAPEFVTDKRQAHDTSPVSDELHICDHRSPNADAPAEEFRGAIVNDLSDDDSFRVMAHFVIRDWLRARGLQPGFTPNVPEFPSWEWLDAPEDAQIGSLLLLAEWWLDLRPDCAAADALKEASVEISRELARQRNLIYRRNNAIRHALSCNGRCGRRCGGIREAIELTAHHASGEWATEWTP